MFSAIAKNIATALVVIVIAVVALGWYHRYQTVGRFSPDESGDAVSAEDTEALSRKELIEDEQSWLEEIRASAIEQPPIENSIVVSDQSAGESVVVDHVNLASSGYAVLHASVGGELGLVLGTSDYFPQGAIDVFTISAKTEAGRRYFVALYADDGDGTWEEESDIPLFDASGVHAAKPFGAR